MRDGQIAEKVGMSASAFSLALRGKRGISALELVRFAEFFNVSVHWLITGETDPFEAQIAARHEFKESGYHHAPEAAESVLIDGIALAYRQAYPEPAAGSPAAVPDAAEVRFALGEGFPELFTTRVEDVYKVGVIRVAGVDRAYSLKIGGRYCIVVGASGNWFFQNFSIAHELGHIHFDHFGGVAANSRDQQEILANRYAADLLMPENLLANKDWIRIDGPELATLVWELGVSTQALKSRLSSLKIDCGQKASELLELKTQALIRQHLTDSDRAVTARMAAAATRRFPTFLEQAHLEGIERRGLAKDTLAWMLDVPAEELEVPAKEAPRGDLDAIAEQLGLPIQVARSC